MTTTSPLDVLPANVRKEISDTIDLALNGEASWAFVIRHVDNRCGDLEAIGRLTESESDAILDYAKSF